MKSLHCLELRKKSLQSTLHFLFQQYLESNWKPNNKKVQFRLLQNPHKLYFRLRSEMIARQLKPVSWTYFWKLTCESGLYEVMTADNCCCGTCRDFGYYNFQKYRELVKEVKMVDYEILLAGEYMFLGRFHWRYLSHSFEAAEFMCVALPTVSVIDRSGQTCSVLMYTCWGCGGTPREFG